jgi:hypothetical protein
MKLFIDESGNTGETLKKGHQFNFKDQPYYCLAGALVSDSQKDEIERFISEKKIEYRLQGDELKSGSIYRNKSDFLINTIDFLISSDIPLFVELMDKKYYLNVMLMELFIFPFYSVQLSDDIIVMKRMFSSYLDDNLNDEILSHFIEACKSFNHETLEAFFVILIEFFKVSDFPEICDHIAMTQDDYFELKEIDAEAALKRHLPQPDKNPNLRDIHLLPNYNAFTNLSSRALKVCLDNNWKLEKIVHDEQKQFDVIFQEAFNAMKDLPEEDIYKATIIETFNNYNFEEDTELVFKDSKDSIVIQITDLVAGLVIRFWSDFKNSNFENIEKYLPSIARLNFEQKLNFGINFMVPNKDIENLF